MNKALIIVDMQIMPFIWKNYVGKALYQEETLLKNVKNLIEKARHTHAPIYYIMYTEPTGSPRAENEPLWQVVPEIAPQENDKIIVKYHADSFLETSLDKSLKTDNIQEVVICGVQTEFCVDTTIKSAYSHGYKVEFPKDGHSTYDSDLLSAQQIITHHNTILEQFATMTMIDDIEF